MLKAVDEKRKSLEQQLDAQAAELAWTPKQMEVDGLSSDGAVFALAGQLEEHSSLPVPIYLCGIKGIFLEGWVHRREDNLYIGHTERWRVDASTLVKGQKVFILPRNIYEADQ